MCKKKPQLLPQVQSKDGSIDIDLAGVLQFHCNAAKRISPLCNSELSLDFSTFSGLEPFLMKLFAIYRQIGWPFSKSRTIDVNTVFLAVSEVFYRPKNCIRQHARRIVTIRFPI